MTISIPLPAEAERSLRRAFGDDLSRPAIEALAIEGYRSGRLSLFEVRHLLGLEDRWTTEKWLADHQVHQNYSIEDLEEDRQTFNRVLGHGKH